MQYDDLEFEVLPEEARSGSIHVPVDLIFQELTERGFLIYNTKTLRFQFKRPTPQITKEIVKKLTALIEGWEEIENV